MNKMIYTFLVLISLTPMCFAQAHTQKPSTTQTTQFDQKVVTLLQSLIGYSGGGEVFVQECITTFKSTNARVKSAMLETSNDKTFEDGVKNVYKIIGQKSDGLEITMKITLEEGGNSCTVFVEKDILQQR